MRSFTSPALLILLLLFALLLEGCSSTKITQSWTAPDAPQQRAQKILLVAVIKDPVTRRFFEQHFSAEAKKNGVDIISSYELSPNATELDEKQEVLDLLKKTQVDGVLVAQLQGVHKEYKHIPSRLDWYPDGYSSLYFYEYFYQSYRAIYRPGYVGSDNFFNMQLRYFSTANEKLLWAGNTQTKNPRSVVGTIEHIADETIDELKGAGIL